MLEYLLIFLTPAVASLREMPSRPHQRVGAILLTFLGVLSALIGLRYKIGVDWYTYNYIFSDVATSNFVHATAASDFAYAILNYIGARLGFGIYFVNLVCAVIFVIGLGRFCAFLPRPWLGLSILTSYLVIAVAMGYTRQSAAIGLVLTALVDLSRGKRGAFIVRVILASAFHKSAVVMIPLAIASGGRRKVYTIILTLIACGLGYYFFVFGRLQALDRLYFASNYSSGGALLRAIQTAFPAVIFLLLRHNFQLTREERDVWTWLSVASLILFLGLFVSPSSTVIDRLGLYLIPIQAYFYSRAPNALFRNGAVRAFFIIIILTVQGISLLLWLVFSPHIDSWVPYRNILWI